MLQQRAMLKELLNRLNPFYLGEHGMSVDITHLLVVTNLAKSREAAKRFLVQGAIEIDGEKVTNNMVTIRNGSVIKVGKRRFVRLVDAD
jgi:tyrosyl-tRNA synthetase